MYFSVMKNQKATSFAFLKRGGKFGKVIEIKLTAVKIISEQFFFSLVISWQYFNPSKPLMVEFVTKN